MLFNTIDFAVFLPVVFILYWFVFNKNLKLQNFLIVASSYFFYGWWDWKFLGLIAFSSIIDFSTSLYISSTQSKKKKKAALFISIFTNIGILAFFKYFNFFLDNLNTAFAFFGQNISSDSLSIVLPVGISFYTFQTLSYTIDVYRNDLIPTKDFIAFSAFVSFFPQLVAGPIERAKNLLPQFYKSRNFVYSNAVDGLRQILWGLFKKVVIADNAAVIVNDVFGNYSSYSSSLLIIGAVLFAFQIYGDFSGYSDIAIGTSKLFGFTLMTNFNFPYFSRDIAEFWRRWHISLSTWFRDYLYIPLGGSKGGHFQKIKNTFIIFLVSGFWHGANWTFIFWGLFNAILFLPLMLLKSNRLNMDVVAYKSFFPSVKEFLQMLLTFFLTTLAWVFFRSDTIGDSFKYLANIFKPVKILASSDIFLYFGKHSKIIFPLVIVFIIIEWMFRKKDFVLDGLNLKYKLNWAVYIFIVFVIIYSGKFNQTEFIYFQF